MWCENPTSGVLAREYRLWHTPVVTAYLFWRFAKAFSKKRENAEAPSCLYFFLLAGVLRDHRLVVHVAQKRTLRTFVKEVVKSGGADYLDGIQGRIQKMREPISAALDVAVASGMLEWDVENAALRPLAVRSSQGSSKFLGSKCLDELVGAAERLGVLFAEMPSAAVAAELLKVRL